MVKKPPAFDVFVALVMPKEAVLPLELPGTNRTPPGRHDGVGVAAVVVGRLCLLRAKVGGSSHKALALIQR